MENEIIEKLERVLKEHNYAKEFSQEAVANVAQVVEEAIRQRSDEYVVEKEKAANAEKLLEEAEENFKKTLAEVEEKLSTTEEKIQLLEADNAEREAKETFNTRMGVLDETYELTDEDRKIFARELSSLDLDEEVFAEYQEKAAVVWKHKDKDFLQMQKEELDAQIQAEVEKRLSQESTASTEEAASSQETVEDALQNVKEEQGELPAEEEETLRDKFAKAFSKENLTIKY